MAGVSGIFRALRVPRGPVRSRRWNALMDALENVFDINTGAGANASWSSSGLTIAMVGDRDRWVAAKIKTAPPAGVPVLGSACKYDVQILGRPVVVPQMTPVYGRPVANDEVHLYPAKVGDLCYIGRNPQADHTVKAELFILSEFLVRGGCGAAG